MLTAVLAALVLQAAPQAAALPTLTNPVWITAPAFDTEPRTTRARRIVLPEGNVEVTCTATVQGRLEDCRISSQDAPPALARAALSAARIARVQPHVVDGQPAAAEVVFGMEYKRPARPERN